MVNKTDDILVSIVIPTYSRNETLTRAVQSAINQTHKNIEIIVVDDNPPDSKYRKSAEKIMQNFRDDSRVVYIRNLENLGGSGARNVGILAAKGEYIAFLDDDDSYYPERIEKQLKCFFNTSQKKLALVFCGAVMTHGEDRLMCYVKPDYRGCCLYEAMVDNCLAATSQWMTRKSALLDVGMFSIVPCKQDSTLILKLLERGYEVECIPDILSKYCFYDNGGISGMGMKNLQGELLYKEACEKLYFHLSASQKKEVEYSFSTRLYRLYKANDFKQESWKHLMFMLKTHFLKTLWMFTLDEVRRLKYIITKSFLPKVS